MLIINNHFVNLGREGNQFTTWCPDVYDNNVSFLKEEEKDKNSNNQESNALETKDYLIEDFFVFKLQ